MTDIYFVLFPIWSGGNHLINVLSTALVPSVNIKDLRHFYQTNRRQYFHYHTGKEYMVSESDMIAALTAMFTQGKKPILFGGHLPFLMTHYDEFKNYGNITIILLDVPSSDSLAGSRAKNQMRPTESYNSEALFYKPTIISRVLELPMSSIIDISTDLFNQPNTPAFQHIEHQLNLGLDLALCNELHTIWMNKIYGI